MKKIYFERSKANANQGSPNWLFRLLSLSLLVGLLSLNSMPAWAKSSPIKLLQKVTGKVTDSETGEALPGVAVVAAGRSGGVATDVNGLFQIEVPDTAARLTFSFIGYVAQTIDVGGRSTVDVQLTPDVQKLDQVVVVGYGTQKKSDVTGSTARVDEKALREIPAVNMQEALQGRAAGLEIQRIGTQPGAGAQIRIRGERSILGSNDPLIVLDGIPFEGGNLNDINPNDIVAVDILKDASATAIYGSRGANGVILVTTRRGKAGQTRISYNGYYGVSTIARKYPVYNAQEYRAMRDISTWTQGYMPDEIASINNGTTTDWQDLMYQNGYTTDHNLTASGGNENTQFSVGGDYMKQTTVLPGQDFARYSLRATADFKLGNFKMGVNMLNNVTVNNGSQFVNPMFPILALSPLMPAYNADGTITKAPNGDLDDMASTYSPLLLKHNNHDWTDRVRRLRTFNSMYGEYEILKGLKYRLNLGLDYRQQESDQFKGADSYFRPNLGNTASVNNSEGWGYTVENLLMYDKTFAQKHHVTITGLYSYQEDHTHNTYISKDSIDADFIEFYNLGQSNQSTSNLPTYSGGESTWALISYMGRVNYAFNDRYMLTVTARSDGSSRLAPGHKWHNYYAGSLGWNVTKESFMQGIKPLSNLKIRAGWGETSNQAVDPYSSLGGLSNTIVNGTTNVPVKYNYGSSIVSGYYVSSVPNPDLDWEYTRTVNIGVDFGVLENRITGSVDVYNAQTHKILYGLSLPATSGVPNNYNTNIGKMENKGIEITLSSTNISAHGFVWSTDLNFFLNRNKLKNLQDGFEKNIANQLFVGQPLSAIYDYHKLGIWQLNEAAEAATYGQTPGQIKLEDLNHDGSIDPDNDREIIGSGEAKWQGGMTNRFSYKGFDFSFVVYARIGGTLNSAVFQPTAGYLAINDGKRNGVKVDYWTPTNPTNDFPMPAASVVPPKATTATSTLGYYDASFVKVRSINFGYTLPQSFLKKLKIQSVRIYVTAQNPFLLYSPYVKAGGVDPEATGTGTTGFISNAGNISSRALTIAAATPPLKSYLVGVNLNF